MELGRRPPASAAFLDDVDRAYVVSQLEGAMDETVELRLAVTRTSPLVLPGMAATDVRASEEAGRAEQFATELGGLVRQLRTTVTDEPSAVPAFSLACPGGGTVRFLGLPRVNLFRLLLEAVRRASTRDHGFPTDQAAALRRLPAHAHLRVFATPT
jgi:hypothetical protein